MPLDLEQVLDLEPISGGLDLQPVEDTSPAEQMAEARKSGDFWEGVGNTLQWIETNAIEPLTRPVSGVIGRALDVVPGIQAEERLKKPLLPLPRAGQAKSTTGKIVAGGANAVADLAEGFSSPDMLAQLPAGANKLVLATWSALMAKQAPEQFGEAWRLLKEGNLQGAARAGFTGVGEAIMSGLIAKHAAGPKAESLPERPVEEVTNEPAPIPSKEVIPVEETQKIQEEVLTPEPTVPAATTEQILGKPVEPELIGMGGATPSEFKPASEKATSIKNASVDAERQSRGQEPIMAPTRLRNEVVWDKAMAKIDTDPAWQDRLIDEFNDNARAATPEETVALDHRYVDLQNEYAKATRDGAQHYADGFELGVEEAKIRAAFFESKLNELEQVSRKIGTEAGRSLQMRQRLMKEDFSLAAMESKMRAAKGFEPLSLEQHAEIKVLHDKLAAAEKNAFEIEQRANKRIALVEAQKALAEAKTQSGKVAYEPRIIAAAERFATFMDRQADAARKRLKERLSRVSAGIDPTMLADVGIIGAAKITRGVVDIAKWTDEMASELGEWIRQHKDEAWAISNKTLEDKLSGFGEGKVQTEKLKRATGELARLTREKEELQARLMLEDYSPRRNKRTEPINKEIAEARADVMLLREQFARELAKENYKRKSAAEKAWLGTKEASNLSRALMTSYDVSAVFRQGGVITVGDPVLLAKAFVPMMRALKSERNAAAVEAEIRSRPNATSGLYERSGLFLAQRAGGALTGMEEAYMSRLAHRIPGLAASERAYVTFLNKLRADAFDDMYADLANGGEAALSDAKVIANAVNVFTGRGNVGNAGRAAESLSTVFFAPRLVASRFQTLAGQPLYRGSMRAKYVIAKRYARLLLGLGTIYGLAKLAVGTVEDDSRSSDYRKLKFGNTRVDPTAGLAQTSVFLTRFFSGQAKSGEHVYKKNQGEVVYEFLRNKLAPVPGGAWDIKDIATDTKVPPGHPETIPAVLAGLVTPMTFGDIYDVMVEQGVPVGTALSLLSALGMSMQTYDSTRKSPKKNPR